MLTRTLLATALVAAPGAPLHAQSPLPGRVVAHLADSTFWPEGLDVDSASGTVYVASLRHGVVAAVTRGGTAREIGARDRAEVGSIFGVRFDARRHVLWATTSRAPEASSPAQTRASLLQLDPGDGRVLRRWDVPAVAGRQVLGDLAVADNGDVYVTDSAQPVLYLLRSGADSLIEIRSPLFRSLQGVAPRPDGQAVYLADYSSGLLHLSTSTGAVTRLATPPGVSTRGCDGIVWHRGSIVAVQNGASPPRIMKFSLDSSGVAVAGAAVIDQRLPVADEPTIGAMLGDEFVYVANSQWEKHDAQGRRIASRPLTPPIVLGIAVP